MQRLPGQESDDFETKLAPTDALKFNSPANRNLIMTSADSAQHLVQFAHAQGVQTSPSHTPSLHDYTVRSCSQEDECEGAGENTLLREAER